MYMEKQSIKMLISAFSPFWENDSIFFPAPAPPSPTPAPYTHTYTLPTSIHREIPGLWVLSARFFGFQRLLMAFMVQRK